MGVLFFEGATFVIMRSSEQWAVWLNFTSNTILYSINMLPMISLFLYFDYRVIDDKLKRKRRFQAYGAFVLVMLLLNTSNYWTGIFFNISKSNVYSRGPGMYFTVGISLLALIAYGVSMFRHMKSIEGRLLGVMLSFTIMPILGAGIQAFNYGVPAMWTMFSLLSLFIFIFVEREDMMRDTLTSLVTRGQFEQRLKKKLKRAKAFTIVMLDMDKFKMINDTFGHDEGDRVLVVVASILEQSIKHIDMASRYGGDEFMILLESTDKVAGKCVMDRIDASLKTYNDKSLHLYNIKLSMGAYYIGDPSKANYADVLAIVDKNMYDAKRS
jgi:diguanylate cyclase (GGDEF)-like protein